MRDLIKTNQTNLLQICVNCSWYDNSGYKDNEPTKDLGFCKRFKQVVNQQDNKCMGFQENTKIEEHHKNLAAAKKLNILEQLTLFPPF